MKLLLHVLLQLFILRQLFLKALRFVFPSALLVLPGAEARFQLAACILQLPGLLLCFLLGRFQCSKRMEFLKLRPDVYKRQGVSFA